MTGDWAEDRARELVKLVRVQHVDGQLLASESGCVSALASALRLARAEGEAAGVDKAFAAAQAAIGGRPATEN